MLTLKNDSKNILQIGCPNEPEDFVVSGTCSEQLYGMCEALWEPNLKPDELFETISQVCFDFCDLFIFVYLSNNADSIIAWQRAGNELSHIHAYCTKYLLS